MGIKPLSNDELKIGKAAAGEDNPSITDLIAGGAKSFEQGVPLWFYVLAEAAHDWRV